MRLTDPRIAYYTVQNRWHLKDNSTIDGDQVVTDAAHLFVNGPVRRPPPDPGRGARRPGPSSRRWMSPSSTRTRPTTSTCARTSRSRGRRSVSPRVSFPLVDSNTAGFTYQATLVKTSGARGAADAGEHRQGRPSGSTRGRVLPGHGATVLGSMAGVRLCRGPGRPAAVRPTGSPAMREPAVRAGEPSSRRSACSARRPADPSTSTNHGVLDGGRPGREPVDQADGADLVTPAGPARERLTMIDLAAPVRASTASPCSATTPTRPGSTTCRSVPGSGRPGRDAGAVTCSSTSSAPT